MLYDKINTKVYVYRRADQNVIRMNFTKSLNLSLSSMNHAIDLLQDIISTFKNLHTACVKPENTN